MDDNEPYRPAIPVAASRERSPKPRWESVLNSLAVVLMIAGLLLSIHPWPLPADWSLDARHNLSDIGLLLFGAGFPLYMASALLTDRRKGFSNTRHLLRYWSVRLAVLGAVISVPFSMWLYVADLLGPPLRLSFPTSLPPVADLAVVGALCLSLLGGMLALPELLWRSWRERRARRTEGVERQ